MAKKNVTATARETRIAKVKKWLPVYLMMLPGAIYLIVNNYIPMLGMIIAFKNVNFKKGILASDFVGLKNFKFLFASRDVALITRNTILYNVAFIVVNTVLSVMFAIFICDIASKTLKKIYQSAVLFPYLMSMVIVGYIVYAFFGMDNGIVNNTILPLLGKKPIFWYNEPKYWPAILIFTNAWKGVGYGCLVYIASINGIDTTYYEAAELDGAGKWMQIRHITLPCILPSIITLTFLSIGKIFYSDFGLFYQVPRDSGMLYSTTNVIDTYVYRGLMEMGNIGMSSAAGVYQSVVGFILVLLSNYLVRKTSRENALF